MKSVFLLLLVLISLLTTVHRIPPANTIHDHDPPGYPALQKQAREAQNAIHVVIGETLETLREDAGMVTLTELTKDMHFYPDLHGKPGPRSPFHSTFSAIQMGYEI